MLRKTSEENHTSEVLDIALTGSRILIYAYYQDFLNINTLILVSN